MPLHPGDTYNDVILQCRKIQEVLNTYRNLMLEVRLEFGTDTSQTDEAWRIGTHAIGIIRADVMKLCNSMMNTEED